MFFKLISVALLRNLLQCLSSRGRQFSDRIVVISDRPLHGRGGGQLAGLLPGQRDQRHEGQEHTGGTIFVKFG